jgi:hypothetical protein
MVRAATLSLGVASCAAELPDASLEEVQVRHIPPSETDLLEALLRSASIPLSVHPLCEELAGSAGSRSIARYVAAILAEQGPHTVNRLDVYSVGYDLFDYSLVTFLPLGGTEEDPQLWGLEFRIRQSDGRVLPDSFRCYLAWEGW